jgi:hypothetical protein
MKNYAYLNKLANMVTFMTLCNNPELQDGTDY